MHQNLVLDAARGEGGKLRPLAGLEALDCLDQSDRADRDEVFDVFAGIVEFLDDVGDEPQVVFDEQVAGLLVSFCHQPEMHRFLFLLQRLREGVVLDVGHQQREMLDEQRDGGEQSGHEQATPMWIYRNGRHASGGGRLFYSLCGRRPICACMTGR